MAPISFGGTNGHSEELPDFPDGDSVVELIEFPTVKGKVELFSEVSFVLFASKVFGLFVKFKFMVEFTIEIVVEVHRTLAKFVEFVLEFVRLKF